MKKKECDACMFNYTFIIKHLKMLRHSWHIIFENEGRLIGATLVEKFVCSLLYGSIR